MKRSTTLIDQRFIDAALAASFPASDPPSWNPGMARPGVVDVSGPASDRTVRQALGSLLGGALLAFLVPVAVLAIGTPVALAVRAVLELGRWLFGVVG